MVMKMWQQLIFFISVSILTQYKLNTKIVNCKFEIAPRKLISGKIPFALENLGLCIISI